MDILPLKTDPKYGYFPRWPEDGNDWLHPEDVATARMMIPSNRVFCRDGMSGEFHILHYGDATIRARPTLWQEVDFEGFVIGDWVEVNSRGMMNERRTGTIREIVWDEHARALRYQILENGKPIEIFYEKEDLARVEPPRPSEPLLMRQPPDEDMMGVDELF